MARVSGCVPSGVPQMDPMTGNGLIRLYEASPLQLCRSATAGPLLGRPKAASGDRQGPATTTRARLAAVPS